MRKRLVSLLLVLLLPVISLAETADDEGTHLRVGNPTAFTGSFFCSLFDGTTSDQDVQSLLHEYDLVSWDEDGACFRFDKSVVEDAVIMDDGEGNRSYLLVLYDDLYYSDETLITARDYAFSLLLSIDPAIAAIGGRNASCSWLVGAEEYQSGKPLKGLRVVSDQILVFTVKAEALPYFYELSRMDLKPYPIHVIAPGTEVLDDGEGAYLSKALDPEQLRVTLLDEQNGYVTHPSVVSGPYILTGYDGSTAEFAINPMYKGDEQGVLPTIEKLTFSKVDSKAPIDDLRGGEFGLLNKIAASDAIAAGMELVLNDLDTFSFQNYARDGMTLVWFCEDSVKMQELAVRKAIALCFDRKGFTQAYTGNYGIVVNGLYGLGQWMYLLAEGTIQYAPEHNGEENTEETLEEAGEEFTLDGMTVYEVNPEEAAKELKQAGWTKNDKGKNYRDGKDKVRYKKVDGELTGLSLTMAIPDSDKIVSALKQYLLPNLKEAGMEIELVRLNSKDLAAAYMSGSGYDMIYVGDNFSMIFDPDYFMKPTTDPENAKGSAAEKDSLTMSRVEMYQMAEDMVHTQSGDIPTFERKWIALQERISQTLPILPVYSNVYFDFYERELHGYEVSRYASWAEAIVPSYISELEEISDEEERTTMDTINSYDK